MPNVAKETRNRMDVKRERRCEFWVILRQGVTGPRMQSEVLGRRAGGQEVEVCGMMSFVYPLLCSNTSKSHGSDDHREVPGYHVCI